MAEDAGTVSAGNPGARVRRTRAGRAPAAVLAALAVLAAGCGTSNGQPPPRQENDCGPGRAAERSGEPSGRAGAVPQADFDRDGTDDLVVLGEFGDFAAVVCGGPDGDGGEQLVPQGVSGVPDKKGDGVGFGEKAVTRDLDGDGHTDLVTDVETYGTSGRGAKNGLIVVWGAGTGLRTDKKEVTYLQDVPRGYGLGAGTGFTLAGGDFDGDGHADLVLGTGRDKGLLKGPFTRSGKAAGTGRVPKPPMPGGEGVSGGQAVDAVAADMNGDGADDLLTVHAYEDSTMGGGKFTAWIPGGAAGFGYPDTSMLPGLDTFTTGDVDDDGFTDLVTRRHPDGSAPDSAVHGPVEVFYGSKDGPEPEDGRHTVINQDTAGVPGRSTRAGQFGAALDAGDVDGDGYADVAVGAPGTRRGTGTVTLLKGGEDGLGGTGARLVGGSADGKDAPRPKDAFGSSVKILDMDGDGTCELAVGAPGARDGAGMLRVFRATGRGLTSEGARTLTPADFGMRGGSGDLGFADRLGG